jgi:hypothetical protein
MATAINLKDRMLINSYYETARREWAIHVAAATEFVETQTNIVSEPQQPKWLGFVYPDVGAHVKMVVDVGRNVDTGAVTHECRLYFHWGVLTNQAPEKLVMYSRITPNNAEEVFQDAAEHIYSFFLRLKRLHALTPKKKRS